MFDEFRAISKGGGFIRAAPKRENNNGRPSNLDEDNIPIITGMSTRAHFNVFLHADRFQSVAEIEILFRLFQLISLENAIRLRASALSVASGQSG